MTRKRVNVGVCAVVVAMLLSCTALHAQMASTGLVNGTVTDQTGAIIAGATVTLQDVATNNTRTATTNDSGRYSSRLSSTLRKWW